MSSSSATIELNTDFETAHRFPIWIALAVFSAVCLAAEASAGDGQRNGAGKWALFTTVLSMILSACAVGLYLVMRGIFAGSVFELATAGSIVALWGMGLPAILNPENDLTLKADGTVVNANLYFFSWMTFATLLYLTSSLVREIMGLDVTQVPTKVGRWWGLTFSSLVVLGSAVRVYRSDLCEIEEDYYESERFCKRAKLAMSVGAISFVLSTAMTYWITFYPASGPGGALTPVTDVGLCTLLMALWCIGVAFITFGDSPGNNIGNLFLATWVSFILMIFLFGQSLSEFLGGSSPMQSSAGMPFPPPGMDHRNSSSSQQQNEPNVIPDYPSPTASEIHDEDM